MKRTLIGLFMSLALLPFGAAHALQEGRDYLRLGAPQPVETGAKIEVREFFWYGCPHCYALEPKLEQWLKHKPKNVEFLRTPATAPRWLVHAQAYYAFAALDATERTHAALFRAIHEQHRPLDDEKSLAEFAKERGIDPQKFRDAYNSFGVRLKLEKAKQMNAAFQITSVPTFEVDGKFVTSASMAGGEEELFGVLDQLVKKAAHERPTSAARRQK